MYVFMTTCLFIYLFEIMRSHFHVQVQVMNENDKLNNIESLIKS